MNFQKMFRMLRVAVTPGQWLLKSVLANGAIVCGKNIQGYGGRGVYIYRDALEPELEALDGFLASTGVFVDIGANTGIYALKAAKHFGGKTGTVLAVEPFVDVLATLYHSVDINGFSNMRLRNFAVGDKTGATTFWMNFKRPHSFGMLKRDDGATSLSSLVVKLDDLFAWEGLDRLDYLKIDAEGAEQQILAGGKQVITRCRPIIQLEVNVSDAASILPNYSIFQAKGSPNKFWIPNEHPKVDLPKKLGWDKLQ